MNTTTDELARLVVAAIRDDKVTATPIARWIADKADVPLNYRRADRAIQYARKRSWIRFHKNKWHLDRPPGSVEGIRVTIMVDIRVDDLANYNATTIEEAADLTRKQLMTNEISIGELIDYSNRVVDVNVEGRHDLEPFDDEETKLLQEPSGRTGNEG